jgi:hypothetical protein
MLSFNVLLNAAGISPEGVRLLRHQDNRMRKGWTTYNLWRRDPSEFRRYEATQQPDKFRDATHVASFVVDPSDDVVFVGLSAIISGQLNANTEHFDYVGETLPPGTVYQYQLERDVRFAHLEGKLVIDWGPGARSWVQRADNQDKPIIEVRRDVRDVEWPGFMNLNIDERDIEGLAPNWIANLSAANGVYLLVCPDTGEQYVGAAFGAGGFLARWRQYAANGHGGNKLLIARRQRTQAPLKFCILEVFGSTMTEAEAFEAESRWKHALGSRAHGLNAN